MTVEPYQIMYSVERLKGFYLVFSAFFYLLVGKNPQQRKILRVKKQCYHRAKTRPMVFLTIYCKTPSKSYFAYKDSPRQDGNGNIEHGGEILES